MNPNNIPPTGGPREPSANSRQSARALRDYFLALIAEGFTEDQALRLIGAIMAANNPNGNRP